MSRTEVIHPDRLPWYAGGRLDAGESAAVEAHLSDCAECRAELEALRSMYRSLRAPVSTTHISVERLVAYHDGAPLEAGERRAIDEHLRRCHACASDLHALGRSADAHRTRTAARWIATAASLLLVGVAVWQFATRSSVTVPTEAARVLFPAVQRGDDASPRLTGPGPWVLEVWTSPAAPASFAARIERGDTPTTSLYDRTVTSSHEGRIEIPVSITLRPGRHLLSLRRAGEDVPAYTRSFEVVDSP